MCPRVPVYAIKGRTGNRRNLRKKRALNRRKNEEPTNATLRWPGPVPCLGRFILGPAAVQNLLTLIENPTLSPPLATKPQNTQTRARARAHTHTHTQSAPAFHTRRASLVTAAEAARFCRSSGTFRVSRSCLHELQELQRREAREGGSEGGGADVANLVIAAAGRNGGGLSKVSFCGIKFRISESLLVTQVAVHTRTRKPRPLRVEL